MDRGPECSEPRGERSRPVDSHRASELKAGRAIEADIVLAIAVGGALGAVARYAIAQWMRVAPHGFPWATFWTNLSGAFVLGFFLTLVDRRLRPTRYVRPFFAVGFLGSYTTFSTLAVETVLLIKDGRILLGAGYTLASVPAGIAIAYLGVVLARRLPIRDSRT